MPYCLMFKIFKRNPEKKLQKQYADLLQKAMEAQRNGKIELYAKLSFESEEILNEIEKLKDKEKQ